MSGYEIVWFKSGFVEQKEAPLMKNQNHIGLLVGCFTSLMLYVLLFFWDASLELSELRSVLRLSVSAVPVFFLQLWLCRLENVRWTRWLPLCTLFLVALVGAAYFFGFVGSGWDTLGGGILLCWCIAPAAGCALGWLTYGGKLPRRLGTAGLVILLAVYVRLKVMGGPFGDFELMDLPAIVVLAMGIWLLLRKEGRIKRKE